MDNPIFAKIVGENFPEEAKKTNTACDFPNLDPWHLSLINLVKKNQEYLILDGQSTKVS